MSPKGRSLETLGLTKHLLPHPLFGDSLPPVLLSGWHGDSIFRSLPSRTRPRVLYEPWYRRWIIRKLFMKDSANNLVPFPNLRIE